MIVTLGPIPVSSTFCTEYSRTPSPDISAMSEEDVYRVYTLIKIGVWKNLTPLTLDVPVPQVRYCALMFFESDFLSCFPNEKKLP